ncbi:MAG: hypothetical protein AVO33_05780 [delta proteobacterium ML8_F1]|nr:MAG: hypothetical protein AVO33_05780 [delta proteobacterium ML8_F1]
MEKFGSAAILAGGESLRMGFDKQIINLGREYLVDKLHRELKEIFSQVIVISNRPELYHNRDYFVVSDGYRGHGSLSGIHQGLMVSESEYLFVTACDMPYLNAVLIEKMKHLLLENPSKALVARRGDRIEPFHGFYSRDLLPDIERSFEKGHLKLGRLLTELGVSTLDEAVLRSYDREMKLFTNLNTKKELRDYLGEKGHRVMIEEILIEKNISGNQEPFMDEVVVEKAVEIVINGERTLEIYASEGDHRELVVGFLKNAGLIETLEDILSISSGDSKFEVAIRPGVRGALRESVTSGCLGSGFSTSKSPAVLYTTPHRSDPDQIKEYLEVLRSVSEVFERTGGVHSSLAFLRDGSVVFYDDIGRHNTLDKIVGHALMTGKNLLEGTLVTTGRISSEMIKKAAMNGFRTVISRSAPTGLAVEIAREYAIELIGFARGNRFNRYV